MGRLRKPEGQRHGHYANLAMVVTDGDGVDVLCPEAPKGLLKSTRLVWEAFWSSPLRRAVDLAADGYALLRWIEAVDERERVKRQAHRQRLADGSHGGTILNPLIAYLEKLEREILRAEQDFGMRPMSRLKLGVAVGQARITAAEMNRALEQDEDERSDGEPGASDWREA